MTGEWCHHHDDNRDRHTQERGVVHGATAKGLEMERVIVIRGGQSGVPLLDERVDQLEVQHLGPELLARGDELGIGLAPHWGHSMDIWGRRRLTIIIRVRVSKDQVRDVVE